MDPIAGDSPSNKGGFNLRPWSTMICSIPYDHAPQTARCDVPLWMVPWLSLPGEWLTSQDPWWVIHTVDSGDAKPRIQRWLRSFLWRRLGKTSLKTLHFRGAYEGFTQSESLFYESSIGQSKSWRKTTFWPVPVYCYQHVEGTTGTTSVKLNQLFFSRHCSINKEAECDVLSLNTRHNMT